MTRLSLKERFERLGPVEGVDQSLSGSPVALSLSFDRPIKTFRSISAVQLLVANGMATLAAKRAIEQLMLDGQTVMIVPAVRDRTSLAKEFASLGLAAKTVADRTVDPRSIRQKLQLTQEQFSLRFGIDLETLRNWEQGKRIPDRTAQSYLRAIEHLPDAIEAAQRDVITAGS